MKCTEILNNDKEAWNQLKVSGWPIIFFRGFMQWLYIKKNCSLPVVQDETKFSSNGSVTTLKSNKGLLPNLHSLSRVLQSMLWVVTPRVVCSQFPAWDIPAPHSGMLSAVTNLCFLTPEWGAAILLQYVWLFSKKLGWKTDTSQDTVSLQNLGFLNQLKRNQNTIKKAAQEFSSLQVFHAGQI